MRVLLSTYDSRGGVEPLLGLAVALRERDAQVQVCAPPDCTERLAEVGVALVPVGEPVRPFLHGTVRRRRRMCRGWRPRSWAPSSTRWPPPPKTPT